MLTDDLTSAFDDTDLSSSKAFSVHQYCLLLTSSLERLMIGTMVPFRHVPTTRSMKGLDGVSCVLHNEYSMLPIGRMCKP